MTAEANFAARQYHCVAVLNGEFIVAGGYNGANMQSVAASPDGLHWRPLPTPPWDARHAASMAANDGELIFFGGTLTDTAVYAMR